MNPFSMAMIDTIYVAGPEGVRDDFGSLIVGEPRPMRVRWQPSSYKLRDSGGAVIEVRDVFYTTEEVSKTARIWTPGMSADDAPKQPSQVIPSRSLDGKTRLTKVVL